MRGLFCKTRPKSCKCVVLYLLICILLLFICNIYVLKYHIRTLDEHNTNFGRIIRISQFCKEVKDAQFEAVSYHPVNLRIIVIVYNRATSLRRLLDSLNNAHYFGDEVALHVWIDRSKNQTIDSSTYGVASDFTFRYGQYYIHTQPCHVGIYGQWMGTYYPNVHSSEIAVILEDDLTMSPYFYKWLKLVHGKYDQLSYVNGYSLQGISIKHGVKQSGYLDVNEEHKVFLYPILGTWGFSPNNRHWRAFSDWYQEQRREPMFHPLVPGLQPTEWYKAQLATGKQDHMWSMWFIYYAWLKHELTVYSNFKENIHSSWSISSAVSNSLYAPSGMASNPDIILSSMAVVVVVGSNVNFQHTIDCMWRPVLMVKEVHSKIQGRGKDVEKFPPPNIMFDGNINFRPNIKFDQI
ncbi:hypothetical protein ACJMK2_024616 [Sinanodonta woodiana]|uniref:Uncharacterized protein n=1 Tax=Sinanodonta woodiana TaxID=1069815 RepID=A0ABD3XGB7_SINWO